MSVTLWDITSSTAEDPSCISSLFLIKKGIRSLGYLPSLSNLRELSVACNSLQDLQGISKLQQLQLLDVSFNQLVTLAGVQQLPQLHTLNAAHNKLTTAESIRGATSLQRLALNNNAIASAAGLLPLSELQGLTALTLSGNPVVKTTPAYAGATARMLPALRLLDKLDAAALLAASNPSGDTGAAPDTGDNSSSSHGGADSEPLSWQELAERQAAAGGRRQGAGALPSPSGQQAAAVKAPEVVRAAAGAAAPAGGRASGGKGIAAGPKPGLAGGSAAAVGSGDAAAAGLQEMESIRYPDHSLAATIRTDGSAMVYWPSGRMAASLELQPGATPGDSAPAAAQGSYQLLAMYDGSGGNVAVTGSAAEGCVQWPSGALMVTWKAKDGSGSRYDEKGKLQQRWTKAERATVQPVELVLGSSMRLTFTPSTGELLLVINAKGLTLQLSTTRGALAPDGSQRCDKRPARVPGAPATSTPTAAAAAGGGGGGGGAHAGKTRTRVQPGRPSGGGDSAAAASSGSAAQPSASAAAAAAAGFSAGAVAAAAEAAEPPGPEELQALLARAKALMATSHPEEKVEEAQAAAAAAAAEEPPAAAVGEDMDEGRESPAQEVE